jgi:broad specificity phosphatase PhoE
VAAPCHGASPPRSDKPDLKRLNNKLSYSCHYGMDADHPVLGKPRLMTMDRVHLVRHAEVENPDGILYGRLPGYPLSDAGREHARAAAAGLDALRPLVIVSSPLERALETAELLSQSPDAEIVVDDRLTEAAFAFEGRRFSESSWHHPGDWPRYLTPWRPGWAEPFADVAARILGVIGDYRRRVPDREVVMVSHDFPIRVTRAVVEGRPGRHWQRVACGYASMTTFNFADGTCRVTYREL